VTLLVACDPSLRTPALAIFKDGVLQRALLVKSPEKSLRGLPAWLAVAAECRFQLAKYFKRPDFLVDVFVGEEMPVYQFDGLQKRRDLLQVQGSMSAIACELRAVRSISYEPSLWKGSVKKEVFTARVESKLTLAEKSVIDKCPNSLRHNLLDSVALGKFAISRL